MDYLIRPIQESEYFVLEDLIYYAVWSKNGDVLPRNIVKLPENDLYITGFGMLPDDFGLVAVDGDTILGAAWIRILHEPIKGFANIDERTPEITIALFPQYRHLGIGTRLMKSLFRAMKEKGYHQASLSVDRNNYAFRLYLHLGFEVVRDLPDDFIMVIDLDKVVEDIDAVV